MSYLHGPFDMFTDAVANLAVPLPVPQGITKLLPGGVQNVIRAQIKGPAQTQQPVQTSGQMIDPSVYQGVTNPSSYGTPSPTAGAYGASSGMSPLVMGGIAAGVLVTALIAYKVLSK